MGKVIFYKTGKLGMMSYNHMGYNNQTYYYNIAWQSTAGTTLTSLYQGNRTLGLSTKSSNKGLFPSSDTFENSSYTDYAINNISGVTINYDKPTEYMIDDEAFVLYSILLSNGNENTVTINSLKNVVFLGSDNNNSYEALSWGYFFDNPIVLASGETKNIILKLSY